MADIAYDRDLIADMLDDIAERFGKGYSEKSYREQARLLREADNTDAQGAGRTVSRKPADGRVLAKARDAWLESDEARMLANDINGPVGGKYLRNRLELAFVAGYEAAEREVRNG